MSSHVHTHTHALPHRKAHSFIFPVGVFYASPLNFPLSPSHGSSVVCRPFVAAHPSSLKTCTIPWLQEGGEEGVSEATLHPPPHIHCFGSTEACQMLDTVVPDPPRQLFIPRCGTGQTASVSPSMLHRADVGREVRHRCMTLRRPLSEGTTCLNRSQTLSHPSAMAKLMWTQLVPKSFQGCLKDCG